MDIMETSRIWRVKNKYNHRRDSEIPTMKVRMKSTERMSNRVLTVYSLTPSFSDKIRKPPFVYTGAEGHCAWVFHSHLL